MEIYGLSVWAWFQLLILPSVPLILVVLGVLSRKEEPGGDEYLKYLMRGVRRGAVGFVVTAVILSPLFLVM